MKFLRAGPSFWRNCSGATAVEFALVFGPLLLLIVATIELGRLMWFSHALDEVAIDTARCLGIRASACATDGVIAPALVNAHVVAAARTRGIIVTADDISLATDTGCAADSGLLRIGLSIEFSSVLPGLDGTRIDSQACFPSQF